MTKVKRPDIMRLKGQKTYIDTPGEGDTQRRRGEMTMKELKEENARLRNALEKIYQISHDPRGYVAKHPEYSGMGEYYPCAMGVIQFFMEDSLRKTEENEA